jgi:hypothetical protein
MYIRQNIHRCFSLVLGFLILSFILTCFFILSFVIWIFFSSWTESYFVIRNILKLNPCLSKANSSVERPFHAFRSQVPEPQDLAGDHWIQPHRFSEEMNVSLTSARKTNWFGKLARWYSSSLSAMLCCKRFVLDFSDTAQCNNYQTAL